MFNRDIIEHVCFQQRVPLDICFETRNRLVILKHCKERKKESFLALNFRLAVNMLQLIYALKSTSIDGFQGLPSPGFHLNTRITHCFVIYDDRHLCTWATRVSCYTTVGHPLNIG
jgi:hypothetical protein